MERGYIKMPLAPINKIEGAVPITRCKQHQKVKLTFICGSQKVIQRLSDLGLTPMSEIALVRKSPGKGPITLVVRRTTIAVANDIAEGIFVRPVKHS